MTRLPSLMYVNIVKAFWHIMHRSAITPRIYFKLGRALKCVYVYVCTL